MPALAVASPPGSLVVHGRGSGPGVGLPEDGALALGRAGKTTAQILATFFPGTTLQARATVEMHVVVWQRTSAASSTAAQLRRMNTPVPATELLLPDGGQVTGGASPLVIPAGGRVVLAQAGGSWSATLTAARAGSGGRSVPRLINDDSPTPGATESAADPGDVPSTEVTAAPSNQDPAPSGASADADSVGPSVAGDSTPSLVDTPTAAIEPSAPNAAVAAGPLQAAPADVVQAPVLVVTPSGVNGVTELPVTGRTYRGRIVTAAGRLVNVVPLESYLRGLREVQNPRWPAAGLEAVVVAARTFALREADGVDGATDPRQSNGCATAACQVYVGAGVEDAQLDAAVAATHDAVLTFAGEPAATFSCASAGGETATPAEGLGMTSSSLPYLTPVTYDGGGHDGWQRTVDLAAASKALAYSGELTGVDVTTRGASGRATSVVLHGSAGDVTMTGLAFAAALQLPSTLFETGSGVAAPLIDEAIEPSVLPALTAEAAGKAAVAVVPAPIVAPELTLAPPVARALSPAVAQLPGFYEAAAGETRAQADPLGWALPALNVSTAESSRRSDVWFLGGGAALLLLAVGLVLKGRPSSSTRGSHRR